MTRWCGPTAKSYTFRQPWRTAVRDLSKKQTSLSIEFLQFSRLVTAQSPLTKKAKTQRSSHGDSWLDDPEGRGACCSRRFSLCSQATTSRMRKKRLSFQTNCIDIKLRKHPSVTDEDHKCPLMWFDPCHRFPPGIQNLQIWCRPQNYLYEDKSGKSCRSRKRTR